MATKILGWTDGQEEKVLSPAEGREALGITSQFKFTTSETPPENPSPGDEWYRESTQKKYTWVDDGNQQWVEIELTSVTVLTGPGGGGGGEAVWGSITGTLSSQTDLNSALNSKANSSSLHTVATSGAYSDLTGRPTLGTLAALNDAPSDGKQYARKDGAWDEVVANSGGNEFDWALITMVQGA